MTDYLSPEWTIQECNSTSVVLSGLRSWIEQADTAGHILLIGPPGSGKSHIVDAVNQSLVSVGALFCRAGQTGVDDFLLLAQEDSKCRVLVDDIDKFDKAFWSAVFGAVADKGHALCATATRFDGRLARLWTARLGQTTSVVLQPLSERSLDIAVFIRRRIESGSSQPLETEAVQGVSELLSAAGLERGFHEIGELIVALTDSGLDFTGVVEAPLVLRALRQVQGRARSVPVILVEGKTDERYLRWAASFSTGDDDDTLEIEACGSASKVSIRAVELRNEGRIAVALFDYDRLGQRHHTDLAEWGLPSVLIPHGQYPAHDSLLQHVNIVVEIEDLIPVADLKRFYASNPDRLPELRIEVPQYGFERLVVHSNDKMQLAEWVSSTLDRGSASQLFGLYNQLRKKLGLPPAQWEQPADG